MVSGSSQWFDRQDAAASDQPQINWNEDGVTPIARLTATGANLVASMSWGEGRLTYHSLVSAPKGWTAVVPFQTLRTGLLDRLTN